MWRAVAGEHATHVKIMTSFVEHAIQQQGKIARELQGRSFVWKRFGVEFYIVDAWASLTARMKG